jgi:hypothetical protein
MNNFFKIEGGDYNLLKTKDYKGRDVYYFPQKVVPTNKDYQLRKVYLTSKSEFRKKDSTRILTKKKEQWIMKATIEEHDDEIILLKFNTKKDIVLIENEATACTDLKIYHDADNATIFDDDGVFQGKLKKKTNGVLMYNNGDFYDGDINMNIMNTSFKKNGVGKMIYDKTGGSKVVSYEGDWLNNLRHGKGKCIYVNESVFKGNFLLGKREGEFTITQKDGVSRSGICKDDIVIVNGQK